LDCQILDRRKNKGFYEEGRKARAEKAGNGVKTAIFADILCSKLLVSCLPAFLIKISRARRYSFRFGLSWIIDNPNHFSIAIEIQFLSRQKQLPSIRTLHVGLARTRQLY